MHGTTVEKVV